MTGPRLQAIIICSHVDEGPPIMLHDLRRQWRTPPDAFWVVADIDNPTEQSFAWQIQLAQRRTVLDSSVETLEVRSPRQLYLPYRVGVAEAKPVVYGIRWLLNGKVAGIIDLDFGFPEAALMRIASLRGSRIDAQKDGTYKVAYRGRELKSDSMLKAEKEAAKAAAKKHRGKPDEGKAA